jgi:hypothetical protein
LQNRGGEVFGANRDAHGLDALIARLAPLVLGAVAVEANCWGQSLA